jgi:hypothetical protein
MANKKIPTAIVVTLGVWIAALGSAAALTYDLNRPLYVRSNTPPLEVPSNATTQVAAAAEPISVVQPVLYLPPMTIVGRYHPAAAPVPKTFADLAGQQCTDWRALEMGSGRVQLCE